MELGVTNGLLEIAGNATSANRPADFGVWTSGLYDLGPSLALPTAPENNTITNDLICLRPATTATDNGLLFSDETLRDSTALGVSDL